MAKFKKRIVRSDGVEQTYNVGSDADENAGARGESGIQAASLSATALADALGPDAEIEHFGDGGFVVRAGHYSETVDRLAKDPIIIDMEKNLQHLSDEELKSGQFMTAAMNEYNKRGGTNGGHIGGYAEAIQKIRAERGGVAGENVGVTASERPTDGTSHLNRDGECPTCGPYLDCSKCDPKPEPTLYEEMTDPNATPRSLDKALLLSSDDRARDLAAAHPNVTAEQRRSIIEGDDKNLVSSLARNPSLTVEEIDQMTLSGDRSTKGTLAMNPACSEAQIDRFLANGDTASSAARNPSATSAQLDTALAHDDDLVRSAAASNPACSPRHIDEAMKSGPLVRSSAMENPNATAEQVEQGFKDRHADVKCVAAAHPKLSPERIAKNMTAKNARVREWTATNPALSEDQINTMLDDPRREVRRGAAMNPSRSPKNIAKAKADPESMVSQMATIDLDA